MAERSTGSGSGSACVARLQLPKVGEGTAAVSWDNS